MLKPSFLSCSRSQSNFWKLVIVIGPVPVTLTEAVLGARIKVPTPTGSVTMAVPKWSNTGTTLRLRGKGAPRRAGGHGDQLVKLKVVLPKEPDPELEAFASSWEGGKTYNPREEVKP
jgi:DnaJ-class molecular chaperone